MRRMIFKDRQEFILILFWRFFELKEYLSNKHKYLIMEKRRFFRRIWILVGLLYIKTLH